MSHWSTQSVFCHIYPLGACGAPFHNDFGSAPQNRLDQLYGWVDHWEKLGANALYLGPLFESTTHGYDTADYFAVDRRLGTNDGLAGLIRTLHQRGIRVILDAVFNHVGRDFWAFKDVQKNGPGSRYGGWFQDLSFGRGNPCGDPFTYATWRGHYSLVKLNVLNPEVRQHLLEAVGFWIRTFDIDGLRLDAADCIDLDFLHALAAACHGIRPDFWLLGEVIHGDYRKWVHPLGLDSVTNYECYKGIFSSLNDKNYFEIAYALDRQFGRRGLYPGLPLYAFADNHDVDRLASVLKQARHLYPAYCLLFTMPGVPSVYYGSEWGLPGRRLPDSDVPLRPALDPGTVASSAPHPDLLPVIRRLAWIRRNSAALMAGDYATLAVKPEQLAFKRSCSEDTVIVVLNAAAEPASVTIPWPEGQGKTWEDILNPGNTCRVERNALTVNTPANWACILKATSQT